MGYEGIVVVGGLSVFNPACGGIEGGTRVSDVVGNASDGIRWSSTESDHLPLLL